MFPVFSAIRYRRNGFEEYRMRESERERGVVYNDVFSAVWSRWRRNEVPLRSIDGIISTEEDWSVRGIPVPVPIRPPQIPHGLDLYRTRAFAVRDWRLIP